MYVCMYRGSPAPSVYCHNVLADIVALFVDYVLCVFCAVMDKLYVGVLRGLLLLKCIEYVILIIQNLTQLSYYVRQYIFYLLYTTSRVSVANIVTQVIVTRCLEIGFETFNNSENSIYTTTTIHDHSFFVYILGMDHLM